jgi:dUTP pyrophosphatase
MTGGFQQIRMKKLVADAVLPTRAHPGDAGMDLYALEETVLAAGQGKLIKTGIAMAIATGHVGLICDRSSMGKRGIKVMGGVVDAGYRGEVMVALWNLSAEDLRITRGDRIAQMLLLPIATPAVVGLVEGEDLDSTSRGAGGFGSTGA